MQNLFTLHQQYVIVRVFKYTWCAKYLEILNSSSFSFQETLKLQTRSHFVEEDNFGIDILSAGVEEILQKVADTTHSDIATDHHKLSLWVHLWEKSI